MGVVLALFRGQAVTNIEDHELRVAEIVKLSDLKVRGNSSHVTIVSCSITQLKETLRGSTTHFRELLKQCVLLIESENFNVTNWLEESGYTYVVGPSRLEQDMAAMLKMAITENFAHEDRLVTAAMRRLTQVARTGGIQGVLSELSRFVDGWAVVLDAHGQVIESVGAARLHIDDAISVVLNRPVRVRYPDLQVHLVGSDANGGQSARLVVASRSESAYRTRSIAAHVADLFAFMIRTTNISEVEHYGRQLMIQTLLTQNAQAEQYLKSWRVNNTHLSAFIISSKTRNIDVDRLVLLWLARLGVPPLYYTQGGEAYGFIPEVAVEELVAIAANFRTNRGERISVGVGQEMPVTKLDTAMRQARQAHNAANRMKKVAIIFSELLEIRRDLISFTDTQLSELTSLLDPLVLSEEDYGSMLETLQVFLAHHGSWKPAASELHIHRQTLMNRIGRIEAALGVSMDNPDHRALLWLALRARDM